MTVMHAALDRTRYRRENGPLASDASTMGSLVYVICEYSGARRFVVLMTFKKENLEDIYFTTALIRGHWFSVTWPRVV